MARYVNEKGEPIVDTALEEGEKVMKITNYVDGKMDVHLTLSKEAIHRILEGDERTAKQIVDSLIYYIKSVRGNTQNTKENE